MSLNDWMNVIYSTKKMWISLKQNNYISFSKRKNKNRLICFYSLAKKYNNLIF